MSSESASTASTPGANSTSSSSQQQDADPAFQCNICFEEASNPVVSLCGHLYWYDEHLPFFLRVCVSLNVLVSWPCIHQWIETQAVPLCPVCKAGIGKDKVIPVYTRGKEANDPRKQQQQQGGGGGGGSSVPNRPQGQRPPPERQFFVRPHLIALTDQGFRFQPQFNDAFGGGLRGGHGHMQNTNFHFSMGFGLFPSLFGFQFAFPMDPAAQGVRASTMHFFFFKKRNGPTDFLSKQQTPPPT